MARRVLTVVACVIVLSVPTLNAWAGIHHRTAKKKVVRLTKTVHGSTVVCHKWGNIQVALKVAQTRSTTGTKTKIVGVKLLGVDVPIFPNHTPRSIYINKQALPLLVGEVMQLKSANIEVISGATDTTVAFKQSLQAALLAAKKP